MQHDKVLGTPWNAQFELDYVPSGKHTKNYGKLPFIVDFPMKNGDFP